MMIKCIRTLLVILAGMLSIQQDVNAGQIDDAQAAIDRNDYRTAVSLLLPLARSGDPDAQYQLGDLYRRGENGVARDYKQAALWFRKAAGHGHAAAQADLGTMYANGKGVRRNLNEASRWWQKAAEGGNTLAQSHLGALYARGLGVRKDYDIAAKWLLLAAERDEEEAQVLLGSMYILGSGVPRDAIEGYKWLKLAERKGCNSAEKLIEELNKTLPAAVIEAAVELARTWTPRQ